MPALRFVMREGSPSCGGGIHGGSGVRMLGLIE